MNLHIKKNQSKTQGGFTLTELLVSIAIMVFILALILVNYRKFDSGIVLTNLAYDVGLSARKAQTYGISVKGFDTGGTQGYSYPYGIHFDMTYPKNYLLFADVNANGVYDCVDVNDPANCERVEAFTIQGVYKIKQLCTIPSSNPIGCDVSGNGHVIVQKLDITFKRPNPDAMVYADGVPSNSAAEIDLFSINDLTTVKKVIVRSTGQISVK